MRKSGEASALIAGNDVVGEKSYMTRLKSSNDPLSRN
jgi:hypothetical protein